MTHHRHRNAIEVIPQERAAHERGWQDVLEVLSERGFEGLSQALEILLNKAMKLERSSVLSARPYERSPQRRGDVTGGDAHDYYYNEMWQLLTETVDGSTYALYIWHLYYIDALAVRIRSAGMYYFLHDANSNVTAAYNITAGSGTDRQVVERYHYTPYGEATFLNGSFASPSSTSAIGNNYLYTGREREPETGLYNYRTRFYRPSEKIWHTTIRKSATK